jgi:dethiobiotin synthetase
MAPGPSRCTVANEAQMKQAYFITGTDTGVGKTLVCCALLHAFAGQQLRSVGMKPVAAGCRREGGVLISEDVESLQAAGNLRLPLGQVNPYAFEPPLAPHIAAARAGVEIALPTIAAAFEALTAQADAVVVEGVGGFRVPLNAHEDTADMAVLLGLPVILVVGLRLGCLNHALLTAEAITQRGLTLAGWVANHIDPDMAAAEQNVEALKQRLPAPCLGVLPHQAQPHWQSLATALDITRLGPGFPGVCP